MYSDEYVRSRLKSGSRGRAHLEQFILDHGPLESFENHRAFVHYLDALRALKNAESRTKLKNAKQAEAAKLDVERWKQAVAHFLAETLRKREKPETLLDELLGE